MLVNLSWAKAENELAKDAVIPPIIISPPQPNLEFTQTLGPITTITANEIAARGINTLAQALEGQAGVKILDFTGDGSQIAVSIRGFGDTASSNSLILIDGVPIINPDLRAPNLNIIPLGAIAKVEIIPGSEGVLYGDQAVGGVINIVTRKPTEGDFRLRGVYGSYNRGVAEFLATNIFTNNISYMIAANKIHNDNYRDHNTDSQSNLYGQINYLSERSSFAMDYALKQDELLLAGALTAEQVQQNRRQAQNNINFSQSTHQFFHINQKQNFSDDWYLTTNFASRGIQSQGVLFAPFTQGNTINFIEPKLSGRLCNTAIILGGELTTTRYSLQSILDSAQDRQLRYDGYANFITTVLPSWDITWGLREAQVQDSLVNPNTDQTIHNRALVTALGTLWRVNPALQVFIRREGNFRFPKADENVLTANDVVGLETQTGASYEMGANMIYERGSTQLNFYQLLLNNEIAFDPTEIPSQPFGINRNLDKTRRLGMRVASAYHLTSYLNISGDYSLLDARFVAGPNSGKRIPFVANQLGRLSGQYQLPYNWNFTLETIYTGSRFPGSDFANVGNKLSGYVVWNLALVNNHKQIITTLRINNLFNKYYNDFASFIPTRNNGEPMEFFYPAPGRNFLVTVIYQFV